MSFAKSLLRAGDGAQCFPSGGRKWKNAKKSSAGPDFLGFAQKIDIILKKHMFFDKKYILFSPYYVYNIREKYIK